MERMSKGRNENHLLVQTSLVKLLGIEEHQAG